MKERPIPMSGPMVRAILGSQKSQTRRVIKLEDFDGTDPFYETKNGDLVPIEKMCPYGKPGDLLWVKETWGIAEWEEPITATVTREMALDAGDLRLEGEQIDWGRERRSEIAYRANGENAPVQRWHSSRFMYKKYARLWLRIKDVRVERLQEISEEDARAEGYPHIHQAQPPEYWFRDIWDSLNAKRGFSWESNPWVWVIEFERAKS